MINEIHIEDSLENIKKIICYYADGIDYSNYIQDLESILQKLAEAKNDDTNNSQLEKLSILENKATRYLEIAKALQLKYETQQNSENE